MLPENLRFGLLSEQWAGKLAELERTTFPPDEAEAQPILEGRISKSPDLQLGAFIPKDGEDQLVGFISASGSSDSRATKEAMNDHVPWPNGETVCLWSLVVAPDYRGHGIGRGMLQQWLANTKSASFRDKASGRCGGWKRVSLFSHQEFVPLYESFGFTNLGPSAVIHGSQPWIDMTLNAHPSTPGLRRYHSVFFDDLVTHENTNSHDIYCPVCDSIVLRPGAATVAHVNPTPLLSVLGHVSLAKSTAPHWVVDSPLTFENISFTKKIPVPGPSSDQSTQTRKYLCCADCDHGPIGWCDPADRDLGREIDEQISGSGGRAGTGIDYAIAVDRVRYKIKENTA